MLSLEDLKKKENININLIRLLNFEKFFTRSKDILISLQFFF